MSKNITNTFKHLNPSNRLIRETDYYQWLRRNYSDNTFENSRQYLLEIGFVEGEDTVDARVFDMLRWIHREYFAEVNA